MGKRALARIFEKKVPTEQFCVRDFGRPAMLLRSGDTESRYRGSTVQLPSAGIYRLPGLPHAVGFKLSAPCSCVDVRHPFSLRRQLLTFSDPRRSRPLPVPAPPQSFGLARNLSAAYPGSSRPSSFLEPATLPLAEAATPTASPAPPWPRGSLVHASSGPQQCGPCLPLSSDR